MKFQESRENLKLFENNNNEEVKDIKNITNDNKSHVNIKKDTYKLIKNENEEQKIIKKEIIYKG